MKKRNNKTTKRVGVKKSMGTLADVLKSQYDHETVRHIIVKKAYPKTWSRYGCLSKFGHEVLYDNRPPFEIGALIVRPIQFWSNGKYKVLSPPMKKTSDGSTVMKANWGECFTRCNTVAGHERSGLMVCFSKVPVEKNWIAMKIVHIAENGQSCIVEPIYGTEKDLFTAYSGYPEKGNLNGGNRRIQACT